MSSATCLRACLGRRGAMTSSALHWPAWAAIQPLHRHRASSAAACLWPGIRPSPEHW